MQPNRIETEYSKPKLPIPPPLMMSEEGRFAHLTLIQRWPTIIRRVIAENDFPLSIQQSLENLVEELPDGILRSLPDDQGSDLSAWASYIAPYLGQRWIDIPWYLAEVYLYRRILAVTNYFTPGQWQNVDPFAPQKQDSLVKAMPAIKSIATQINNFVKTTNAGNKIWHQADLITLIYFALWGNRIDLSVFPTDANESERTRIDSAREQAHILVDHSSTIAAKIANFDRVRIDFIIDNAGFELFCDLCLVDFLLDTGIANQIYLHLKPHPLFVSDAMIKDVDHTIELLTVDSNEQVQLLGCRLQNYITQGRLLYREDYFWTAPLPFWEMPARLRKELAQSSMVLIKGDANYRRLLGDCEWSFTACFADIVCYFPAPCVAMRTLKSELAAGLQPAQVERLNQQDPHWLTNGEWGVIQFVDN